MVIKVQRPKPYMPANYEPADIAALQALRRGDATPDQQSRALAWVVESCCETYGLPYFPGGEDGRRDSDFAMGKAWVGKQIVKLLNMRAKDE